MCLALFLRLVQTQVKCSVIQYISNTCILPLLKSLNRRPPTVTVSLISSNCDEIIPNPSIDSWKIRKLFIKHIYLKKRTSMPIHDFIVMMDQFFLIKLRRYYVFIIIFYEISNLENQVVSKQVFRMHCCSMDVDEHKQRSKHQLTRTIQINVISFFWYVSNDIMFMHKYICVFSIFEFQSCFDFIRNSCPHPSLNNCQSEFIF